MERIVALFDIHVPFQINLHPVWKFISDFKPTTVILGGDVHDFSAISHWVADQSRALDGGTLRDNFDAMDSVVIQPLLKVARKASKIYLTGNHEDWLRKAGEADPNLRGFIELEKNVKGDFKILPLNVPYKASSHLYYVHGVYWNLYHARKTVEAYGKSILYGHVHDFQTYTHISPIDVKHSIKGQSCGCLCHLNPAFMKNKPNRWSNGFSIAYVEKKTGYFWDYFVPIIEGKFVWNGREYK